MQTRWSVLSIRHSLMQLGQLWPSRLGGLIVLGLEISVVPVKVHLRRLLHRPLLDLQRAVAVVGDRVMVLGVGIEGISRDPLGASWVGSSPVSLVLVVVPKGDLLVVSLFLLVSSSLLDALSVVVWIISGETVLCWHRGPPLLSKAVSFQLEALVVVLLEVQQLGVVLSKGVVSVDVP